MGAPGPGGARLARSFRWGAVLLGLVVLGCAVVLFVLPAGRPPHHADAVVVLGGPGPRIERAERLVRDGFVDVVVLATETPSSCLPDVPVEQICFTPSPSTTRGEARAVAELARQRGWDDVLVVVQNEQAFRAGIRLERCVDDGVRVTLVTVRAGPARSLARTGYEVLALPKAVLFERSC